LHLHLHLDLDLDLEKRCSNIALTPSVERTSRREKVRRTMAKITNL